MSDESSAEPDAAALVPADAPGALRRSHQVKVTLNAAELAFLDGIVAQMGSDRSSVFRHLLRLAGGTALQEPAPAASDGPAAAETPQAPQPPVTRIELKGLTAAEPPSVSLKLYEPRSFDELPAVLKDLEAGVIIVLNLTLMDPDQAQRAVDFTAGGTFTLSGHQERVGESIFLFAPRWVSVASGSGSDDPALLEQRRAMLLKEGKPAAGAPDAAEPAASEEAASEAAAAEGSGSEAAACEQAGDEKGPAEQAGAEPISAGPMVALPSGPEAVAEDATGEPAPEVQSGEKPAA